MTLEELREQLVIDSQVLRGQFERTIQLINYIEQQLAKEQQNANTGISNEEDRGINKGRRNSSKNTDAVQ